MIEIAVDDLAPMVDRLIRILTPTGARSSTKHVLQSRNLSYLAHRRSRGGHRTSALMWHASHGANKGPHPSSKSDRTRRSTISKMNGPLGFMLATSGLIGPWLWAILKTYLTGRCANHYRHASVPLNQARFASRAQLRAQQFGRLARASLDAHPVPDRHSAAADHRPD
jgi:hypothetical protein